MPLPSHEKTNRQGWTHPRNEGYARAHNVQAFEEKQQVHCRLFIARRSMWSIGRGKQIPFWRRGWSIDGDQQRVGGSYFECAI